MKFCVVGSGAVGGYYGAKLARAGHDVVFIARGPQLAAIRERGLVIKSPLGDFTVRARAEDDASSVPPADVAIFAVKTYSNPAALPLLARIVRDDTSVLTLQNGVDSVEEVAAAVGAARVLGGTTYLAAALISPGVIEQTGTHRRVVFGEVSGAAPRVTDRVQRIHEAFTDADIASEPVADARLPIWEKYCYLAPFAGFTGAARLPIGPLWSDPSAKGMLLSAFREVEAVGRAESVPLPADLLERIVAYLDSIPPTTRSSLLIDLQQGKPIEVDALLGGVVRRAARWGLLAPIVSTLYGVLKPHAHGTHVDVRR